MIDYEIISSGSKGNCVVIEDVMIDCGVAYKRIKERLYDIRTLLLTHIHGDHINKSTLEKIKIEFPKIRIVGNYEVHQKFKVDIIVGHVDVICGDFLLTPFDCIHNVVTTGYAWKMNGDDIIYATDTSSLEHAPGIKYDYLFIESNYDEKKLQEAIKMSVDYNPAQDSLRHLSTQQAKGFYYTHRKSKDSEFIELHKSRRFY